MALMPDEHVDSLWREPDRTGAEATPPALEFRDVFRIFRAEGVETVALRGLSLRVEPGEMVAVRGPSGCGKSTMLALAAGLDRPSAGEVRAGGLSLGTLGEPALARYRAAALAVIFQADNLWPALTALENVILTLQLASIDHARDRARRALNEFGLGDRARHRVRALSGGEQQRVAIAAAAARQATLVLADEPTGELDAANEQLTLAALTRLREEHGSTIVIVTHSSAVAAAADRVIELSDGRAA